MLVFWDLGISSLVLVISLPLLAFFVRRKQSLAAQRREEIRRLLIHASEEAARAELEACFEFSSVSLSNSFHCPVCYCPATTRCSRCKSVRYCSGKCQIIHWRQGHKDECRPASIVYITDDGKSDTDLKFREEREGRKGHKGLFPYELFVKLYTNKIDFQPCGLINSGNSCFANVVFQCLIFTPPLTTYFLQKLHSRTCPIKEQCFTCGFENLLLKAKEGKSPLSPNGLLLQLQNIGISLGNGKQEDAHEFLRFVVDRMQSVCIKASAYQSAYDMPKTRKLEDTTLIGLTFGGYLRSKIKCMKCQGKSEQHEKIMDLTVEIDGDISTLDDALHRFTRTEILGGENKYRCGRCKSYERAKKKLRITEPPNILTVALKRFQSGKFGKLNKLIKFPETLDLAPYVSGKCEKSHDYKLYGVIVHLDTENATFSGHYVCSIRNSQNKWFKADDSTVVTSDVESVLTKGAYMLFYSRCSPILPRLVSCTKTEATNKKSSVPIPKANVKSIYKYKAKVSDSRLSTSSSHYFLTNRVTMGEGDNKKKGDCGGGRKNNDSSAEKKTEPVPVVLKVDMHCECCPSRIVKCVRAFQGVETVKLELASVKLTVTGEVDPEKLREKVQEKTKKKVDLISPQPKKEKENKSTEDKNKEKKSEEKKPDNEKKPKETPVTTAILKLNFHCPGCIGKIQKFITKTKGVNDITMDKEKQLVTVKGTMDVKKLVGSLTEKLKRPVEIVPPAKKKKEKEKESGDKKEGGDGGGKDESGSHPAYGYGYYPGGPYGYPIQSHAPQIFSDENPNACVVM